MRNMSNSFLASRDKLTLALRTNMFSISDTFTCFPDGEFIPRDQLCSPEDQEAFSAYILLSSGHVHSPGASRHPQRYTDGSFTKTWKHEKDGGGSTSSSPPTPREVKLRSAKHCAGSAGPRLYTSIRRLSHACAFQKLCWQGEFFVPYDSVPLYVRGHQRR